MELDGHRCGRAFANVYIARLPYNDFDEVRGVVTVVGRPVEHPRHEHDRQPRRERAYHGDHPHGPEPTTSHPGDRTVGDPARSGQLASGGPTPWGVE